MSRIFTVAEGDDGIRLDRRVARNPTGVPFTAVARWARTGRLRLDGGCAKPRDRVQAGQVVVLPEVEPARPTPRAQWPPPSAGPGGDPASGASHHRTECSGRHHPPGLGARPRGGVAPVNQVPGHATGSRPLNRPPATPT